MAERSEAGADCEEKDGGTVIFSRGRGSGGRHHKADDARRPARRAPAGRPDPDQPDQDELDLGAEDDAGTQAGPYDLSEAPAGVDRLDLGSLQIPAMDGVEVRVQADPEGVVQQVVLVHGDSALQLGVFAAPRTAGIWDEVRAEIRKSLFDDGVAAEDTDGEYGVELRARVRTPEGLTDIRFIGVDGPRWMVRAVYQGKAAVDPSVAGPLAVCLHGLVVDRGNQAMPVRDPLPLRLPREVAERAEADRQATGDTAPVGDAQVDGGGRPGPGVNGSGPGSGRRPSPRPRRSR
jgi:hypothetical protein